MAKLENSVSVLCNAIFDADEVQTPCTFVILPYKLSDPAKAAKKEVTADEIEKCDGYMNSVIDLPEEEDNSFFSNPASFTSSFFSSAKKKSKAKMKKCKNSYKKKVAQMKKR